MRPHAPTAKHASVMAVEVAAKASERSVSFSKHSSGMAAYTSDFLG